MDENPKVNFYYQKSNLFRVIHADGAWGGLTPDLQVFFSLFNSGPAMPQMMGYELRPEGTLEDIPAMAVSKDGIVREVEVGIVMSPENVKALIAFLEGRLRTLETIKNAAGQTQAKGEHLK